MIQVGECLYFAALERELAARMPDVLAALDAAGLELVVFEFEVYAPPEAGDALDPVDGLLARLGEAAREALGEVTRRSPKPGAHPVLVAYTHIENARLLARSSLSLPGATFAGYLGELEGGVEFLAVDGTRLGESDWEGGRDYLERLCRRLGTRE